MKNAHLALKGGLAAALACFALSVPVANAAVVHVTSPTLTSPYSDSLVNLRFSVLPNDVTVTDLWYAKKNEGAPSNQGDDTILNWVADQIGADSASVSRLFKCSSSCDNGAAKTGGDGKTAANALTVKSNASGFNYLFLHSGEGGSSVSSWLFAFSDPITSFTLSGLPKGYSNASAFNGPAQIPSGGPPVQVVPIPTAAWLFGSALIGLAGVARRRPAK